MVKYILGLILSFCILTSYAATGLCSAFFISSNGYIATAGHCHGTKTTAFYYKNGQIVIKPMREINLSTDADLLIGKVDDKDLPFFSIDPTISVDEQVMTMGYPLPNLIGFSLKNFRGRIIQNSLAGVEMELFGAPGSSGSVVFNSCSNAVGVLVAGYPMVSCGYSTHTVATASPFITAIALKLNIPITISVMPYTDIDNQLQKQLTKENQYKIVQLLIEE